MNTQALVNQLKQQPFKPFEIIASSGERYTVRHPELVLITDPGVIYVFQPKPERGEGIYEMPNVLSIMHVNSIEPIRPAAEASAEK